MIPSGNARKPGEGREGEEEKLGDGELRKGRLAGCARLSCPFHARNSVSRSKSVTICKRRRHESPGLVNILSRMMIIYKPAVPLSSPFTAVIVG